MGAQQGLRIKVEGVVHGTRRMMVRDIQRAEIMMVVLNFRAFLNREPQW